MRSLAASSFCTVIMCKLVGESIYDQKPPNPKQIDTKGILTDSGRICHVK